MYMLCMCATGRWWYVWLVEPVKVWYVPRASNVFLLWLQTQKKNMYINCFVAILCSHTCLVHAPVNKIPILTDMYLRLFRAHCHLQIANSRIIAAKQHHLCSSASSVTIITTPALLVIRPYVWSDCGWNMIFISIAQPAPDLAVYAQWVTYVTLQRM